MVAGLTMSSFSTAAAERALVGWSNARPAMLTMVSLSPF
jgi:hypothetical protein